MENKSNLAKAVIAVMKEVQGMEKNSKVGDGKMQYSGTKDSDVKEVFNEALSKNGLCIMPIDIEESTQVDRWDEQTNYGVKQKQSVFTKVKVKYILLHESGESQVLAGYGHGVDSQDKGAGKATTYAMKNMLLYSFMTPVGKIDDTETTHSEDISIKRSPLENAFALIESSNTIEVLKTNFLSLPKEMQKQVEACKNKQKTKLEAQAQ